MWYLSPFACLYDLLQFGFGHLNGFESSSEDAGRESVVDARAVALAPAPVLELDADAPALVEDDEEDEDDACALGATLLYPEPEPDAPGIGDATRDDAGVLSGVFPALPFRSSAVGAHAACPWPWPCTFCAPI